MLHTHPYVFTIHLRPFNRSFPSLSSTFLVSRWTRRRRRRRTKAEKKNTGCSLISGIAYKFVLFRRVGSYAHTVGFTIACLPWRNSFQNPLGSVLRTSRFLPSTSWRKYTLTLAHRTHKYLWFWTVLKRSFYNSVGGTEGKKNFGRHARSAINLSYGVCCHCRSYWSPPFDVRGGVDSLCWPNDDNGQRLLLSGHYIVPPCTTCDTTRCDSINAWSAAKQSISLLACLLPACVEARNFLFLVFVFFRKVLLFLLSSSQEVHSVFVLEPFPSFLFILLPHLVLIYQSTIALPASPNLILQHVFFSGYRSASYFGLDHIYAWWNHRCYY